MVFVVLLASTHAQLVNLEESDAGNTRADQSNTGKADGVDEEPTSKNERICLNEVAIELTKKAGTASLGAAKKALSRGADAAVVAVMAGSFSLAVQATLTAAFVAAAKAGAEEVAKAAKDEATQEAVKMVAKKAAKKAKKLPRRQQRKQVSLLRWPLSKPRGLPKKQKLLHCTQQKWQTK